MNLHNHDIETPPRWGCKWTCREECIVGRLLKRLPLERVARRLGRTHFAIAQKASWMGINTGGAHNTMPSHSRWLAAVAEASRMTGVPSQDILSKSRKRRVVRARWVAFKLMRDRGYSLPSIGAVSGYDHSTVLHSLRRLAEIEAGTLR